LPAILHQCREDGMRDFTHSLCELVLEDKVLKEIALDSAPRREALVSALKGIDSATSSNMVSRLRS
jgi:Tfp pilus assembly ATPase PilU